MTALNHIQSLRLEKFLIISDSQLAMFSINKISFIAITDSLVHCIMYNVTQCNKLFSEFI